MLTSIMLIISVVVVILSVYLFIELKKRIKKETEIIKQLIDGHVNLINSLDSDYVKLFKTKEEEISNLANELHAKAIKIDEVFNEHIKVYNDININYKEIINMLNGINTALMLQQKTQDSIRDIHKSLLEMENKNVKTIKREKNVKSKN